jgi:PEGA domain
MGFVMSKVIAVVACGLSVAACSASIPDFLKSSPSKAALRFESVPTGAEVKVSGQSCRTPCELTLEVAELSATIAHKGYQSQTISVRSETGVFSSPRFIPNPVHADLQPVGSSAKRQQRKEIPVAAENPPGPVSVEATASSNPPANSAGWSYGDVK